MAKPKKIYLEGYDFYFWNYENQTKMKHKILSEYFSVWAHKLGKYYDVSFFDGYGGCGGYIEDNTPQWGSSILIAEIAKELHDNYNKKIDIFVTEKESDNYNNLKKIIEHNSLTGQIKITNEDFEKIVLSEKAKQYFAKIPTLFFIDPFGYNLKMDTLKEVLSFPKSEILLNFMFTYINRFVSDDSIAHCFDKLYGCESWRNARGLFGEEREKYLINLFKNQLKTFCNVKYVFPYRLSYFDKKSTYYYLFHATNHIDGCTSMKSCFAKHNYGKVEYLGCRNEQLSFISLDQYNISEITRCLLQKYTNNSLTFTEILEDLIDDTLFLESGVRKAIKQMEKDSIVKVNRVDSKTDRGLSGKDVINFMGASI